MINKIRINKISQGCFSRGEPWGFVLVIRKGVVGWFWLVIKNVNLRLPYRIDVVNVKVMESILLQAGYLVI